VARLLLLFVFEHLGGEIVGVLLAQAADGEMPFVVAGKIEVIGRIGRPVACRALLGGKVLGHRFTRVGRELC
jgi:hypothetical protein